MAAAGVRIDERIGVRRLGAGETARLVLETVSRAGDYDVVAVGPGRYQLSRSYRPTWAVPFGVVLTVLLFGLGIVLFFVKRNESCAVTVVDDRTGVHVRVVGQLLGAVAAELRRVLDEAEPSPSPAVTSFAPSSAESRQVSDPMFGDPATSPPTLVPALPSTGASPLLGSESTVQRTAVRSSPASVPAPVPTLRFSSGRCILVGLGAVIGRDPVCDEYDPDGAALVAVDDQGISKTHLSVRSRGGVVEIRDRHSTNGTVVHIGGVPQACPPGEWLVVPAGSILVFGDQRAEVAG